MISIYLILLTLLNLTDIEENLIDNKDYLLIIINNSSCHECLLKLNEFAKNSDFETIAILSYSKSIIKKKQSIKHYKSLISPSKWYFTKEFNKLNNKFDLSVSPNVIVIKNGNQIYFTYEELFINKSKLDSLENLLN